MKPRVARRILWTIALVVGAIPSGACGARTNLYCDFDLPVRERPSLYFILDRSGSMLDGDKWNTVRRDVSDLIVHLGSSARVGAAVFPAPGGAGCSSGIEVMALRNGEDGSVDAFLRATDFPPSGGTPTADTIDALAPMLRNEGRTYAVLATDGGPNCRGTLRCSVERCTANIIALRPSCQPNVAPNCCDPAISGGNPFDCLDDVRTEEAVANLAASGVPVYVVGIEGSAPYADLLDRLARAGRTARTTAPSYYRVDSLDSAALTTALSDIATRIGRACRQGFVLPEGAHVTSVTLDGAVAPDSEWTYEDQAVVLTGGSCDRMQSGASLRVRGTGGCMR